MSNGALEANGAQFSVVFVNNSTQPQSACIFQQQPDLGVPDAMSLAWLVEEAAPTTMAVFTWSLRYSFVWSETSILVPGVRFEASQILEADLTIRNQVTFTEVNGAYTFQNQTQGPRPGSLSIIGDSTIALDTAAVGIGMSNVGTFAVLAQPRAGLAFTPHPEYWIAFGVFQQGEVLDTPAMRTCARIEFPPEVFSMTAILNVDYTWTIQPTSQ